MRKQSPIIMLLMISVILSSCKKNEIKLTPLGSMMIVNAVVGGTAVKLGSYAATLNSYSGAYYGLLTGTPDIYVWPIADSTKPYFNGNKTLTINNGDIYSLYMTGTPTAVDAFWMKEESIPYRTDSTAGVRFVNLSPNSPALKITKTKTPTVAEVNNLTYKQITDFLSFPGKYNSADTFQIRNAATNAILATFGFTTATTPRFANVTLVIKGNVGGTGASAFAAFRVNNDR